MLAARRHLLVLLLSLAAPLVLPAAASAVSASIGPVDCDAGGAIATLTNTEGGPVHFTILRDDVAIATAIVPAGPAVTRVVPIAEGAAAQVTVRYGSSYASSYLRRSCTGAPAEAALKAAAVSSSDAPFAAAPVAAATGVRSGGTPRSTPSEPQAGTVTLEEAEQSWPLVLVALAALFGLAIIANARLRNRLRALGTRREPAAPRRA